jgi:CRISPR-associated protein Csb1
MSEKLTSSNLFSFLAGSAAAFRSVTRLQPAGGPGDKIFPATYSGGVYSKEKRKLEGEKEPVDCVLVDSVQSSSNRAEEALKHAIERGKLRLPLIIVNFADANKELRVDVQRLTSLDVPHRLADAILRDSVLSDGTRFSKSMYAQRWTRSNLWNATPIYELCPTALLFGMWGSPDKPGGLGAKFERAYVSETVAVNVTAANEKNKRTGFRIDPLNASKNVGIKSTPDGWAIAEGKEAKRPSEINHGNILFESDNSGVRCEYVEQTTVVSLGALRKLRFPVDGNETAQRNDAARAVLAALGLCAGVLAAESGTSLRSRCTLWPEGERVWEVLEKPGEKPKQYQLSGDDAVALLKGAVKAAETEGLAWLKEDIELKPSRELIELVRRSQEEAAKDKGEGESV